MSVPLPATTVTPTQVSQSQCHKPKPPSSSPNQIIFPNKSSRIDPIVKWTSSIARHCRNGRLAEAAVQFSQMRLSGVDPNHITFITLLSACADFPLESFSFGASIHGYARKLGLDTSNVMVGTAILDMYAKCGLLGYARLVFDELMVRNKVSWNTMIDGYMRNGQVENAVELFDEMPERDRISWTALIGGFVKRGHSEEALEWFREMQVADVEPDYVTVIAVLAACADLGTVGLGLWMNRFILNKDFKDNIKIMNSLIDMYSRCGCIEFARQVFEKMTKRTLVSWNSMIVGFAVNGYAEEALKFFDLMQREGFKPDGVSFTGALTACSHAGFVDEGLNFFENMKKVHGISHRIEHYGCIVDLYSRAGRLEDALNAIENMPMKPNEVVLGSLLAACRTQGDITLAERLMKYLYELDPGGDSNYVLLANIYAAVGRWDGANEVRKTMKARGIQKTPGFSSIEIDCDIHEFVAGDQSHVEAESIYSMLEVISFDLKASGYVSKKILNESYEDD